MKIRAKVTVELQLVPEEKRKAERCIGPCKSDVICPLSLLVQINDGLCQEETYECPTFLEGICDGEHGAQCSGENGWFVFYYVCEKCGIEVQDQSSHGSDGVTGLLKLAFKELSENDDLFKELLYRDFITPDEE